MLQGWIVIAFALGYIGLLFVVASYGDRTRRFGREGRSRRFIYPLSLAIYCTSWTFFGSVGSASRTGYEFLTISIGPVLMVGLFAPLITRIVRLAKAQNITSIADFIAARYGKNPAVAATVIRAGVSTERGKPQVRLDKDHPAPDGQGHIVCRRPRTDRILDPTASQRTAPTDGHSHPAPAEGAKRPMSAVRGLPPARRARPRAACR